MPKFYGYHYADDDAYIMQEEGHGNDISWEELQEREYADEEEIVDVRYPWTYC